MVGIAIALVALALLGEVVARLAGFGDPPLMVVDPEIEYYFVPNREYRRFGRLYRINSHSMRSDEIAADRSGRRGSTHALFGDSVVYGANIDQSATIAQGLQRLLAATPRDGSPAGGGVQQVMSIAAPSWGPENLLAFYRRFGPFPGNTAWVLQSTHDMIDVADPAIPQLAYWSAPPLGALHDAGSAVVRRLAGKLFPPPRESLTYEAKRARADVALAVLISQLKADYARVVLVFHATRVEVQQNAPSGELHFKSFAERTGIEFISTLESYRKAYQLGAAPHYDDIHPSESGALLLSRLLYSSLADNLHKRP